MKRISKILMAVSLLYITAVSATAQNTVSVSKLDMGIKSFGVADYETALNYFREVIIDSGLKSYHSDAYFWIAKSYMALRKLDNAEQNLEFFISNFPEHRFYPEALYQKGRLLFLQQDYENCIQENQKYIEKYPEAPFTANAYYWTAESLYSLGRLQEAEKIYSYITYKYPSSYKVESANYRLGLIEQKYREESLIDLLKLTHEEYLKSLEEFQVREKTYEKALDNYQKRLSLSETGIQDSSQGLSVELLDLQTKLRNKDNEIMALKRKIAELEYRLTNAETKVQESAAKVIEVNPEESAASDVEPADTEEKTNLTADDRLKLLEIKSRAQEIKNFYLEYLSKVGRE